MNISFSIPLLFSALFISISSQAQTLGCTDVNASNFSPSATLNDGSCVYANTSYLPIFVANLEASLAESSGLIYFNESLWTHNDSGNPSTIYEVDSNNGNILRSVYIKNAQNIDWEAIAQNSTHIFLGDFGNNSGSRQDLRILKLPKSEIASGDSVYAEFIYFNYPEQTSLTPTNNTNFDAEAFFLHNDSLHLFTKNWGDQATSHYVIPSISGTYNARLSESFAANGLITDANIDETSGHIVLLGYKNVGFGVYTCFSWLLSDYTNNQYFSGNKRRIEIGNALQLGQTEGIYLRDGSKGYISSESISNSALGINEPAKLHKFDFTNYFPTYVHVGIQEQPIENIQLYPNPASDYITIKSLNDATTFSIFNIDGKVVLDGTLHKENATISVASLASGTYYLQIGNWKNKKQIFIKFQ